MAFERKFRLEILANFEFWGHQICSCMSQIFRTLLSLQVCHLPILKLMVDEKT